MTAGRSTWLNAERRTRDLESLAAEPVDVLVVGGGVTGAGVALDAASRGLTVGLVERDDLASGTSRWSSKLAHGGLRYIGKGQISVAWESAVERNLLFRSIAPHLVRPMPFLLPMLPGYPPGSRWACRGLFGVADLMRAASRTPAVLPRTSWVGPEQARRLVPSLHQAAGGAYVHVDGALEDDARLVIALARTAAGHGARIVTHCPVTEVGATGVQVTDAVGGGRFELPARCVVVAAGVWTGGLVPGVELRPSRGSHLVVRAEALGRPSAAVNVMLPGDASRLVFAVPRPDGTALVGLTDDVVDSVSDVPSPGAGDERWLLDTLNAGLSRQLTPDDVIGRFAGLRPLLAPRSGGASAGTGADLSRRHALIDRDGVVVIVGGKLTTYRRMAQDAVDLVCRRLRHTTPCRTASLPLVGAGSPRGAGGLPDRLVRRFGSEAARVADSTDSGALEPLAPGLPALRCEAEWARRAEGAITAEDVVERRLRLDLVDAWRSAAADPVGELLDPN